MKTIKIFLGSSITELKTERVMFGDYIMNSVRPIFKNDGIEVEVLNCGNICAGNTGVPPQNKIDKIIRECNVSVFMFKAKAGDMTVHEFDVARKLQKRKRHEIYVYCFNVRKTKKSQELKDFQDRLVIEPFYWYDCKDITDLESQFILCLLKYERQLLGKAKPSIVEQESKAEQDADAKFAKYQQNERAQAQLREEIHQNIKDLLQQTKNVMANEDETIAARIFKVIELYKKADQWATATDYDKEKYSDLLFDYAGFLNDYGLYKDAETVYLRQISIAKELYGKEDEKTAASYNEIGVVYMNLGEYSKALAHHRKALKIRKIALGNRHPATATTYNEIGVVYWNQGDYTNSLKYYEKALAIREKVLGMKHSDTAQCYNNIGAVYWKKGDYNKTLEFYLKSLAIWEIIHGTEHPNTAASYNNIGLAYWKQGDYKNALKYCTRAMDIAKRILGLKHPNTALTYDNLGQIYQEQGDLEKSFKYYKKGLIIRKTALGTKHPSTATSYNHLGSIYDDQGDYDKALEYYIKALAIREKVLGTEHPDTADSYFCLGVVYYHLGKYKTALDHLSNAQQIYEKVLGSEHPNTKKVLNWIVSVNKAMKSTPDK